VKVAHLVIGVDVDGRKHGQRREHRSVRPRQAGGRTWRRNTATSCRSTRISAFFDRELRARSPNQAITCRKTR
jgi:hypothetical protein